jgi:hypothetical protein
MEAARSEPKFGTPRSTLQSFSYKPLRKFLQAAVKSTATPVQTSKDAPPLSHQPMLVKPSWSSSSGFSGCMAMLLRGAHGRGPLASDLSEKSFALRRPVKLPRLGPRGLCTVRRCGKAPTYKARQPQR